MNRILLLPILLITLPYSLFSQTRYPGAISGKITDGQNKAPVEYANIVLRTVANDSMVTGTVSDSTGFFLLKNIPFGTYVAEYSFIGYEKKHSGHIVLDRKKPKAELGELILYSSAVTMNEVNITADPGSDDGVFISNFANTGSSSTPAGAKIAGTSIILDANQIIGDGLKINGSGSLSGTKINWNYTLDDGANLIHAVATYTKQ